MKKSLLILLFFVLTSCSWPNFKTRCYGCADCEQVCKIGGKLHNTSLQIVLDDYYFESQDSNLMVIDAFINGEIKSTNFQNFIVYFSYNNINFTGSFDNECFYIENGFYIESNHYYETDCLLTFKLDDMFRKQYFPSSISLSFSPFFNDRCEHRLQDTIIYKTKNE